MIHNSNPDDQKWWDREIDSYLPKRTASPRRAALIIFTFVGVIAGIATCHEVSNRRSPLPVKDQPKDSIVLILGHQAVDGTVPLELKVIKKTKQ